MRTIIIILSCLFLISCATTTKNTVNSQSWRGQNVKKLIAERGQPIVRSTSATGNTTYTYVTRSIRTYNAPPNTITFGLPQGRAIGITPPAPMNPPGAALECLTTYEVNPQGIIVNVQKRGQEC